jgi:catechol 2,3-dioxygenase-like lactoylglutathione lyase family enzyme
MHRVAATFAVLLLSSVAAVPAAAQLTEARDAPIVYGHLHLNTSNIPEMKKFWAETLGGTIATIGTSDLEIIRFPNVLLFWRTNQAPTGGSKGTTADHLGLSVPSLEPVLARVRANGFRVITPTEVPAGEASQGDIVTRGATRLAFVMGPDDAKVELVENTRQTVPVRLHHQHFFGEQNRDMRDWYANVFGGTPREGPQFPSAQLPGVLLNFSQSASPVVATQGRVYDHIGFEVKNLEEFCKQLEAQGIALTVTYRRIAAIDTAIAFVTDPWGTSIELSEGLAKF